MNRIKLKERFQLIQLKECGKDYERIILELCDVANFALFGIENCKKILERKKFTN